MKEAKTNDQHKKRRDSIAAMEKALADEMTASGYDVINVVKCQMKPDVKKYASVRAAYALHFKTLGRKNNREIDKNTVPNSI